MSRDIDRLLQECLDGIDAGLAPEDCLSAWPEHRAELEPLLRQAILLRVAYATAPAEDFKARARDKLMFMAGREAAQALQEQPSAAFVRRTRQRLLSAAGASTQESLRAVPPPRLAFWVNARRRLLEAASARPVPAAAPRFGILAYRSALSAAVVVLAIAVAGIAYFTVQTPKPSVSAELASIEQQLEQVEEQSNSGNPAPPSVLVDLAARTSATLNKINTEEAPAPIVQKGKELIDRQQNLVNQAVQDSPTAPTDLLAAKQKLNEAEVRIAAAGVANGVTPVSALTQPTAEPTAPSFLVPAQPSTAASSSPVVPPTVQAALPPLGPGEVRIRPVAGDRTSDLSWSLLETQRYRVLLPSAWTINGVQFDANGVGKLEIPRLTVIAGGGLTLSINLNSGEINGLIGGSELSLREETQLGGDRMTVNELVTRIPSLSVALDHMLSSVVHTVPTSTPSPTATPTLTSSPAPAPSATPTP